MKIVLKYLKPMAFLVLLSVILLFGQAMSDLTLPNLMSDIVNVGIQLGGVEDAAPKAISEDGHRLITLFMSEDDKAAFDAAYTRTEPSGATDAQKQDYPALQDAPVYLLHEDAGEEVGSIYGSAALSFMTFIQDMAKQNGNEAPAASSEDGEMDLSGVDMTQLYAMLPSLEATPKETLSSYIENAKNTDSMMGDQVGTTFTRLFYTELGVDMDALQQSYIVRTGGKMLLVALLGVAAAVGVGFLSARIGAGISRKLRRDVFAKVESFSNTEFDKFSTASLITRTTNDIQQIQMLITMGLRMMCYAPIMGIGGVVMALSKSASLSWTIAVAVIVLLGLILFVFVVAMPKFKILQNLVDRINLVARENLSGMMVIRAFGNEQHEKKRFDKANRDFADTNLFVQRVMSFMMPAMMLIMNGVTLLIVWVGGHAIADATLQIGDMMAFMQYAMQIIMSFLFIAMMFIMVPRAAVSANRVAEVLDTPLAIHDPEAPKPLDHCRGEIEFRDVSFRYHNAENDVLEHISFTARPGQTTAFIGSTGSGKSTLINLVPRFYDVTEGAILLDGVDIRDIPQEMLRQNIGYVPQKGILFSGDIASNIRYGKEDATDGELAKAIEVAQAKEFVDSTEQGVDTPIAQGGGNVSGGQKQRLSIARALVKNPPVYIFDDSFSALDFKTDAALRKALKETTADATVLIVAQRVSTIMNAEQIVVLDAGRVVGIGTHKELLENCEEYREIAQSQLSKEELA